VSEPRALPLGRVTTFGATCIPQVPPERLREVARAAEDEGLDELWLWEDCFWGGGIATAAAVLAWTTRLRVGIGVLPVPLRNVALTAMETATLHRLFPGRVTVGVGHGVQDWMGQVGARPESPVTLLREYIEALCALLRGDRVTTHGRYVQLDDVQLGWPPAAAPAAAPAVLAAARGPRTLRLSGEVADGSILDQVTTLEHFRSARESIDAGRAAAGRSDPHRVVQYMAAGPGADRDGADPAAIADTIRSWTAAGADTVVLHPTPGGQDPIAHIRFAARQVRPLL
jgi:alkanesulfonate monooxygenase SsuD/methylene tetrahydromethanopterin reductase-like flavin-dependent oxidoreductase (luciferase family)